MRILGIDPGEKRIGVALSDPGGSLAVRLAVIEHVSRPLDAARIAELAHENSVDLIIVGAALDEDGKAGYQARRANRLAAAIRTQTNIPVVLWDESNSTAIARQARLEMGVARRKRSGHMDDLAAAVILQSYLDATNPPPTPPDYQS